MTHPNDEQGWYSVKTNKFSGLSISRLIVDCILRTFIFSYTLLYDITTPDICYRFKLAFADKIVRNLPTFIRVQIAKDDRQYLHRQVIQFILRH